MRKANEFKEGFYTPYKSYKVDSLNIELNKGQKIYLEDYTEYILVYTTDSVRRSPLKIPTAITSRQPLNVRQNSFDLDLFIIPFKIRPSQGGIPTQLNTNFNVSAYCGLRRDFMTITARSDFKSAYKRNLVRNAVGGGCFLGIGSTAMNPFVTKGKINYEYDGFTLHYGISGIFAVEKFNAGIAFGFDYLMDYNSKYWIYQNKPWIGVLLGLNLN